jgi:hypothetical protein
VKRLLRLVTASRLGARFFIGAGLISIGFMLTVVSVWWFAEFSRDWHIAYVLTGALVSFALGCFVLFVA